MRISIDIPDWAATARLILVAGTECVAQKLPQDDFWMIKEARCQRCGECCLDSPATPYGIDDEGKCNKLVRDRQEWLCAAGMGKPLRCVLDPNLVNYDACSITHRKVKA